LLQRIFAHGWWTRDGQKMSKSVGNVLDPAELVKHYGADYVRYFLASEFHFGNDGDFAHDAFCHRINLQLANELGNLAQRTLIMAQRSSAGAVPHPGVLLEEDQVLLEAVDKTLDEVRGHLEVQAVKSICDAVNVVAKLGNKYFDTQAPWLLVKHNPLRLQSVLYVMCELLRQSAILLQPVMPASCDHMLDQLGIPSDPTYRNFAALSERIVPGTKILTPRPVFPKVEAPVVPVAKDPVAELEAAQLAARLAVFDAFSAEEVTAKIAEVGMEIREKKLQKVSKEELKPLLQQLTYLKNR